MFAVPMQAEEPFILQGVLSCPIPSLLASMPSTSTLHEQCSCEGIVPYRIKEGVDETDAGSHVDQEDLLSDNDENNKNNFAKCRCLLCEEDSSEETTFAWECDFPVVNGCWGFDCQGLCQTGPLPTVATANSLDYWLHDASILEPFPTNHLSYPLAPSPSPSTTSFPSASSETSTSTRPPTAAMAAQSASLLWIISFLAVTHNSTDFWSPSSYSTATFGSM